jgi:hypothetical protein
MAAPSEFTVARVLKRSDGPWKGNDGTLMMTEEILLEGDDRKWKVYHEAARGNLEDGQRVEGWKNAEKGTFGWAKPKGQGQRSSSAGGSGPGLQWRSAPYERGAEHPRNEARIVHTVGLSEAREYYRLFREENFMEKPKDLDAAKRTLLAIADWLASTYDLDAVGASESLPVSAQAAEEVPADREGLNGDQEPLSPSVTVPF